jgi:hypothetical protein
MENALTDELLVLESMFPDLSRILPSDSLEDTRVEFLLEDLFRVELSFSTSYPATDPPLFNVVFTSRDLAQDLALKNAILTDIQEGFQAAFVPGEGVLCLWMELLLERLPGWKAALDSIASPSQEDTKNDHQRSTMDVESGEQGDLLPIGCPLIHHSDAPLINKKSVFVAHAALITSAQDIALVKQVLLSDKKIARATHNITAFRWVDASGLVRQECDDDGETAAGGRLLHMLQSADCRGVFVMVSRWYGGIQLGPQRFKDINNCARDLLESVGLIKTSKKKAGK